MALTDKLLGLILLLISISTFTYYTVWTLFLPFLPDESPLQQLFPEREWAIRIPALLMLAGLTAIGSFVGLVLVRSARKKAAKGKGA